MFNNLQMIIENSKVEATSESLPLVNTVLGAGLLVVGDVHGKVNEYEKILKGHKSSSVQVGDFGFKTHHEWHLKNVDCSQHRINFGNHDDYTYLNKPHSLSDWSFGYESNLMTVRGAYSIDKAYRTENIDWWANEELSYQNMIHVIDCFKFHKPKIMITHDCPDYVRRYMFGIRDKSLTTNGLQDMFEFHQPDLWIFGHHHRSKNEVINGTRFICLSELEAMVL